MPSLWTRPSAPPGPRGPRPPGLTPIRPHLQGRGERARPPATQAGDGPAPALPPSASALLSSEPGGSTAAGGCHWGVRQVRPAPLPDSWRYRYTRKFTSSLVMLILASPHSDGVRTTREPPPAGKRQEKAERVFKRCPRRRLSACLSRRWRETPTA